MKTQHFFIVLAAVAVLVTACKKSDGGQPPPEDSDFRSQWVGDWDFVVERKWFNLGEGTFGQDTVYYTGKINYGTTSDELSIKYLEQWDSILVKVNEEGELLSIVPAYLYFSGKSKFEGKNKVYFKIKEDALGGGGTDIVDGIKKEGDRHE